jgi:hypothetical protein
MKRIEMKFQKANNKIQTNSNNEYSNSKPVYYLEESTFNFREIKTIAFFWSLEF